MTDARDPDGIDDDAVDLVPREGWAIATEDDAAWAVSILAGLDEEEARIERGIAAVRDAAARRRRSAQARFAPMLEAWYRSNPPRRGKSIKLPTGVIGVRAKPGGPVVRDTRAALEWARDRAPHLVRVVEKYEEHLDKNGVKAHVEQTGEIPPGVEVEAPSETFYVSPPKGGTDAD